MFLGEFEHQVDPKNRVSVPKKFRAHLKEAVLTRGLDSCLFLYPISEWKKITAKIGTLPLTQKEARSFSRYFLSGATETAFDSLGRVLLPQFLKDYAQIKSEVTIVGVGERVEIWDTGLWFAYRTETEKNSEEIAEKLSSAGI